MCFISSSIYVLYANGTVLSTYFIWEYRDYLCYNQAMKLTQFRNSINFRDLGGYPTTDGRKIKDGIFYRSGGLFFMNDNELEEFHKLGIKTVIDLRTATECQQQPDPDLGQAIVQQHSGVNSTGGDEIDFSPKGMLLIGESGHKQLADLTRYYLDMPFENDAFRIIFEHIRKDHTPLVFHCTSGKDRTGVAAMMVMGLLGCGRQSILDDYLLSNQYCRQALEEAFDQCDVDLNLHPERKELLQMMHGVSERIGTGVYDNIIDRYGTIENFLEANYGFTPEEINEIRNHYLD